MDPLIAETLDALRHAGWSVETAAEPRPLPTAIAERYPALPPLAVEFVTSIAHCVRGDEGCCLFGLEDYEGGGVDGIGWDHSERIFTDPGPPPEGIPARLPDRVQIESARRFWDKHFPIFSYWIGDYEYLAISADPDAGDHGAVVHGYVIDFDSPGPVAPDFRAFLEQLRDVALAPPTRSLVYDNYLALLVHPVIVEDGSTPPWERGLRARLRRLIGSG